MTLLRITVLVASLGLANTAHAEDAEQLLVIPCTGCHTPAASLPAIYGRSAADLESSMQALKTGARESTIMQRLLRGYSDEDIVRLAKALSSMPSAVE